MKTILSEGKDKDMDQFKAIKQALQDLRDGKIILVVDDPDRENEGDFICAAEFATTENINFMATHGKGLICMPMSEKYVRKLQIPQMVRTNTDNHETAFTISIDHVSTTTGISAKEPAQAYSMRCKSSSGSVWSGIMLVCQRADRKDCFPFLPFLMAAQVCITVLSR